MKTDIFNSKSDTVNAFNVLYKSSENAGKQKEIIEQNLR